MTHAAESHCFNGGCTRPLYRGRKCYRCWAGDKWTSMWQRLANTNGKCASYVGLPLGFTKETLIQWVIDNPPPTAMKAPSIDRIAPEMGYVPGNIRWLERSKNSSGANRDLPDDKRICSKCKQVKPADNNNFPRTFKKGKRRFSTMCHPCNRVYQAAWREEHRAAR